LGDERPEAADLSGKTFSTWQLWGEKSVGTQKPFGNPVGVEVGMNEASKGWINLKTVGGERFPKLRETRKGDLRESEKKVLSGRRYLRAGEV